MYGNREEKLVEKKTQKNSAETKKPNYITMLCTNLSITTRRMDLAGILCAYKSSICSCRAQFCKSLWPNPLYTYCSTLLLILQQFLKNVHCQSNISVLIVKACIINFKGNLLFAHHCNLHRLCNCRLVWFLPRSILVPLLTKSCDLQSIQKLTGCSCLVFQWATVLPEPITGTVEVFLWRC